MSDFEASTLAQLLARHAGLRPAAIALLAPGAQPVSYAQLFAMAQSARPWLASRGLAPAARVAVLMPSGLGLAISCVVIACGAVCIPLHAGLAELELLNLLGDARADAVMGLPGDPLPVTLAQKLGLATLAFDMQQWLEGPSRGAPDVDAPWPDSTDTAFVLFTSGTTGKPKRVPLGQRQVVCSAHHIAQHLDLSSEDRALCVMPAYHSHGLIGGLLAPLAAGSSVVCAPAFDAAEFPRWIRDFRPTWYTASPTIHHAVVEQLTHDHAAPPAHGFRLIRTASSMLPAELQRRMEDLWGVPVIQTYGMTETATQLASNPLPPGVRKAGSVGRPVGAELRVIDDEGHALSVGQTGSVIARGPAVFAGYEDAPETNAEAFLHGWFLTGDLGWFDHDGYLFLAGRSREMINRGGEKISPFEVEQALMRLPGVAQAVAYPVAHPTLGENVHAAIVRSPDSAADGPFLRSSLFGVIADFKIPACIHVIDRIPQGAGGKVQRRNLEHQVAALLAAVPSDVPLTPLQSQIAALFARVLDQPRVAFDANFLAIGGDSLSAARLVLEVNETWGVDLPASALLAHPTVTTFTAELQAAIEEADALSTSFESELGALSDDEVAHLLGGDTFGGRNGA
ncbi:non-ribosomal peptide synthetase [Variovorax sp. J22P240]|uniref:non-ribosomal peptide synthetase n=1 Tax=Variovorax sp. J22P240 TaxID=3053514 RepID=UPI002574D0BE|nr:non-ribosomal peptide synthetase [Variovorax sp. J22P240]MDM0001918.1 non-ribosomal peptide synthetase [Variovorax sp. J22P240]